MIKTCIYKDGELINIGSWNSSTPMPVGAVEAQKEVAQDKDGGWYVVGQGSKQTENEILKQELINTQKLVVELQFELLTNNL